MRLTFSHQESTHRLRTIDKVNRITVETEFMHLQGVMVNYNMRGVRRMCTYFVCSHRGWRDVFPLRTEPSRYASLPSQCFCSIAHKLVKQSIIVVALCSKRL
jgi:hypothetical protein